MGNYYERYTSSGFRTTKTSWSLSVRSFECLATMRRYSTCCLQEFYLNCLNVSPFALLFIFFVSGCMLDQYEGKEKKGDGDELDRLRALFCLLTCSL